MKKYILIILLLLFIKNSWAQNTNLDYKNAIKIYNLSTFEEYRELKSDSFRYTATTLQLLHPTIAFQWKTKKNNFHEIELTNFMLSKVGTKTETVTNTSGNAQMVSGNDLTTTLISLRYEYILNFNKSKDKKLVPSIGFGINPYFKQNNYSPKISSSFPTSEDFIGARTFITPRLTYYIKPKIFIDINVPLCLFDTHYLKEEEDNPAIPANQRTATSYDFELFPKIYSGRLGIGLKI